MKLSYHSLCPLSRRATPGALRSDADQLRALSKRRDEIIGTARRDGARGRATEAIARDAVDALALRVADLRAMGATDAQIDATLHPRRHPNED